VDSPRADVADMVAEGLRRRPAPERGTFLRELLAHTAAGLVILEGEATTSEVVYRLADAVVSRGR